MTARPATVEDISAVTVIWQDTTGDFMEQMPKGFGAPMHAPPVSDKGLLG